MKKSAALGCGTVLRLINRDRNIELQPGFCLFNPLIEFRVAFRIEPIGGLEQVHPQVFGVIRLRLGRRKPIPQLALLRLEVVPQFDVIWQRIQDVLRLVHATY